MPIVITCECGKSLRCKEESAGKKVRCPACNQVSQVPGPRPAPATAVTRPASRPSPATAPARKARPRPEEEEEILDVLPADSRDRRSPRQEDDEEPRRRRSLLRDDEEEPRPRRRRPDDEDSSPVRTTLSKTPKKKRPPREKRDYDSSNVLNNRFGQIITGVLMMVGAAAWFFVGLAADRIYFYPPVLFVLGIGAIIKGVAGSGD